MSRCIAYGHGHNLRVHPIHVQRQALGEIGPIGNQCLSLTMSYPFIYNGHMWKPIPNSIQSMFHDLAGIFFLARNGAIQDYPAIHFLFRQTHDTKINWNIINRQSIAIPIFGDENFPTKSYNFGRLDRFWIIYSESPNLLSSLAMGIHGYPKSCQRPTSKSENRSPIIDVFVQDIIPFKGDAPPVASGLLDFISIFNYIYVFRYR